MPRGSKPGERRGGRKRGTPNKATAAQRQRAAASGQLPHEFLLAVARGEIIDDHVPTFAERMDAASKAAPYFAPRLATIEASVDRKDSELDACQTADDVRSLIARRLEAQGFLLKDVRRKMQ